jgi:hypothetical protein
MWNFINLDMIYRIIRVCVLSPGGNSFRQLRLRFQCQYPSSRLAIAITTPFYSNKTQITIAELSRHIFCIVADRYLSDFTQTLINTKLTWVNIYITLQWDLPHHR